MSGVQRAVVVGAGVTGVAVRRHLEAEGYEVDVIDDAASPPDDEVVDRLVKEAELVVPSPGVTPRHTVWGCAERHGVPIVGELDLAQAVARQPIVAITASNGKTTITTLVTSMLTASGCRAVAAGNIGAPLIDAVKSDAEIVVAEVSSFQLYASQTFHPAVGLWANAAPNHLDWHDTFDEYLAAKARIWTNQTPEDFAVANIADPVVMKAASGTWGRLITFGPGGTFRQSGTHLSRQEEGGASRPIVAVDELARSRPHDIDNALAAIATAICAGAEPEACASALREFEGVPLRVELVGEAGGVSWYNDSAATTPESVLAALRGFDSVVLIAGGRNKGLDLSVMAAVPERVRAVVAIGESADEVSAAFRASVPVAKAYSMDEAVTRAACLVRSGDVVLLSPGCASFDWYGSYIERGADFTRAVLAIFDRGVTG